MSPVREVTVAPTSPCLLAASTKWERSCSEPASTAATSATSTVTFPITDAELFHCCDA